MTTSSSMVHVRVSNTVKEEATKALAAMGLSVSDAVRMLLVRTAAEQALPFDVRTPNATTIKALIESKSGKAKHYKTVDALFKDSGI